MQHNQKKINVNAWSPECYAGKDVHITYPVLYTTSVEGSFQELH